VIEERKYPSKKGKDPLSFEICIFHNCQPDRDEKKIKQ